MLLQGVRARIVLLFLITNISVKAQMFGLCSDSTGAYQTVAGVVTISLHTTGSMIVLDADRMDCAASSFLRSRGSITTVVAS